MIIYLLKSIVYSAAFAGCYWLFLRDRKLHHFNRLYLILAMTVSLLLPLFTAHIQLFTRASSSMPFVISGVRSIANLSQTTHTSGLIWLYAISAVVTVTLLALLVASIVRIYRIKAHNPVTRYKRFNLIMTDEQNAPFTFLKDLFWRRDIVLTGDEGSIIFKHELAHIRGMHSIDKLFCQTATIFFWMNPFFWFIYHELSIVHEYIADSKAIADGDADSFARMLLTPLCFPKPFSPVFFFNNSAIKRRLIMITTSNTTAGKAACRKILAIPFSILVAGAILVGFSTKPQAPSFHLPGSDRSLSALADATHDSAYVAITYFKANGEHGKAVTKVIYDRTGNRYQQNVPGRHIKRSIETNISYAAKQGIQVTRKATVTDVVTSDLKGSLKPAH